MWCYVTRNRLITASSISVVGIASMGVAWLKATGKETNGVKLSRGWKVGENGLRLDNERLEQESCTACWRLVEPRIEGNWL